MNKSVFIVGAVVTLIFGVWFYSKFHDRKSTHSQAPQNSIEKQKTYWTCPMHPHIHSDKSGECPICHMKLVQVKEQNSIPNNINEIDSREVVLATPYQLKLIGIQKVAVEKMDLISKIPISGRLISQNQVAIQIYEEDILYVKAGQKFTATSSYMPEDDIQGFITSVDTIADPTSRTIRVLGRIQSGPRGLISETTFSGEIQIPLKNVIAIPESTVLHAGNVDLVYLVQEDGGLRAQKVKLGQKTETYYEIRDGLTEGEFISSGPNFLIDSEAKIRSASQIGENLDSNIPSCPKGQHWDIPMSMCMPGEG